MSNSRKKQTRKTRKTGAGRRPTTALGQMLWQAGYTRETFAKIMKVATPSVAMWATNGVPAAQAARVAKMLGVDPSNIPTRMGSKKDEVRVPIIDQIKALEQAFAARLAALDEERAALNAKFATDRGALVAALAKEIEVYRQYLGPLDVTVPVEQANTNHTQEG